MTGQRENAVGKVCIIGAGASGITAAKALQERNIPFDCFERRDRIGGIWATANSDGTSAAYRSLRINTSKAVTGYSDHPLADDLPDFPHHTDVDRYLNSYVDRFDLRARITLDNGVARVEPVADDGWEVTLTSGETRFYDWLVVANGHNERPHWPRPAIPGAFSGHQLHSHEYLDPTPMQGKRVVVVGLGNTAVDVAVECSYVADYLLLSCRRGAHVIPRYVLGRPADHYPDSPWLPFRLRRVGQGAVRRMLLGPPDAHGLPAPGHRFGQASPTISGTLLPCLAEGRIHVRRELSALDGDYVVFADGTRERVDVIVYCTGYEIAFPFFGAELEKEVISALPLHLRMFVPGLRQAAFIGLVQQWGALFPIAEAQAAFIAGLMRGELELADRSWQWRLIERERRRMRHRYVGSARHAIMLDTSEYLLELARARRRARRCAAGGWRFGGASLSGREGRLADVERT